MTLPNEELRSIKMAREFLREISTGPRMPMKVLRERARACLHHWPIVIERRYEDVCHDCGDMNEWCRCKKQEDK
jgi:hypothetical protein